MSEWARRDSNTTPIPRDFDAFCQPEVKPEAFAGSFAKMLELIDIVKRDIIAIEANDHNRPLLDEAFTSLQNAERSLAKLLSDWRLLQ